MTFELLEHTADVGIEGRGATCEEAVAAVGEGLATLLGAWFPGEGVERVVVVEGDDREALLAAWVDELLYLREVHDVVFGGVRVDRLEDRRLEGRARLAPRADRELEGVGVKAATYHRLSVATRDDGTCVARIFVDV